MHACLRLETEVKHRQLEHERRVKAATGDALTTQVDSRAARAHPLAGFTRRLRFLEAIALPRPFPLGVDRARS